MSSLACAIGLVRAIRRHFHLSRGDVETVRSPVEDLESRSRLKVCITGQHKLLSPNSNKASSNPSAQEN